MYLQTGESAVKEMKRFCNKEEENKFSLGRSRKAALNGNN